MPSGSVTVSGTATSSRHFASFVGTYLTERSACIVEAVARAAEGLDWTPLEVALVWVRDRPGVTAPIVGARTAAQLRGWSWQPNPGDLCPSHTRIERERP